MGNRRDSLLTAIREWEDLNPMQTAKLMTIGLEQLCRNSPFGVVKLPIMAALLYLQRGDALLKNIVLHFLRETSIPPFHQDQVPAITPLGEGFGAIDMFSELAKIMWLTEQHPMVICVDQIEGLLRFKNPEDVAANALGALGDVSSAAESSLIVVSCLEGYKDQIINLLPASIKSRLLSPPSPQSLDNLLQQEVQLEQLLSKRLQFLYESMDVEYDNFEPIFPIPRDQIRECLGIKPRQFLEICGRYRNLAVRLGDLPKGLSQEMIAKPLGEEKLEELEAKWQAHLDRWKNSPPEKSEELAAILGPGLVASSSELEAQNPVKAGVKGRFVETTGGAEDLCVGVCNKDPRGGGLQREVQELVERAGDRKVVIVRTTDFPKSPKASVSVFIGDLLGRGARRAVIEEGEWRSLVAWPDFEKEYVADDCFGSWKKAHRPLTRLPSIHKILGLEGHGPVNLPKVEAMVPAEGADISKRSVETVPRRVETTSANETFIRVGVTNAQEPRVILLEKKELTKHAAFLGGTGSGKSTAAMNVIEQLLLDNIPVLLIDRKGDLASYADSNAWQPGTDVKTEERRELLMKKVCVQLFTPGHPSGRPISVSILPDGCHLLPEFERKKISGYASGALAEVMGMGKGINDNSCRGILKQALLLLTETGPSEDDTLSELIGLLADQDARLINRIGRLDANLFRRLVQYLETLRINRGELFSDNGVRLNVDLLFGKGSHQLPGRTRLSILSTKFLADNSDVDFFITQLLMELARWISRNPKDELQAVVMFDEADIYLPATRKPSTKAPMEDLLKRARSGGLGVFLATQSPGDFDYKCKENVSTWFLGKIKENTALEKIRPMVRDRVNRLPDQNTGHFHLVQAGRVTEIISDKPVVWLRQLSEERILEVAGRTD